MSLPLAAKWEYMHEVAPGSRVSLLRLLSPPLQQSHLLQEYKLTEILKNPKEWV
jgi:hypothetical protein